MIDEKNIAMRYIKAQKKRSILLIFGIVLAIALVSTLFSMLNIMQQYEIASASENGVWLISAQNCTDKQAQELARRVDVSASGKEVDADGEALFGGKVQGQLKGCDKNGAAQLSCKLIDGTLPSSDNQIAIEQWALQKIKPGTYVGDSITIKFANGTSKTYTVSGIIKDHIQHKEAELSTGLVSLSEAQRLAKTDMYTIYMQVANGVDINKFVSSIEKDQHIDKSLVGRHTALIDVLGRGNNKAAINAYLIVAFLAFLVIFSAILMIYNAFNISVTQRVRQFGMLRAIGATPKQIRKVVKSEALFVSLIGMIPGLITGIIVSNILNFFLQHVMPEFFTSDGPSFYISWISLLIGAVVGVLATLFSSLIPARKAGKVSPVVAISASGTKVKKKKAMGFATKIIPVESALSLRRLMLKKRSFALISLSLSFGILLMLCFSPVLDMLREGTSHNYDLGDMYIARASEKDGFSQDLINDISKLKGIQTVNPKRLTSVDATFSYKLLGAEYKNSIKSPDWKKASSDSNGMVKAASKSVLIGMTDNDLQNANSKLMFGKVDPSQLNNESGVVLLLNCMGSVNINDLRPGEFISVGSKRLKICGIIKTDMIMYTFNETPFIGMYTTNKVFNSLSSSKPNFVTMTLKSGADSSAVFNQVQDLTKGIKGIHTDNQSESKDISERLMITGDVFIYGFIAVIALIGILNIINTMSTNIMVRTREIGLLRASGMTMGQVTAMVVTESALYGILALIIGLAVGIPLEKKFYLMMVKEVYSIPWVMPWNLILVSSLITIASVVLSILSPLHHIKNIEITEAVTVE